MDEKEVVLIQRQPRKAKNRKSGLATQATPLKKIIGRIQQDHRINHET